MRLLEQWQSYPVSTWLTTSSSLVASPPPPLSPSPLGASVGVQNAEVETPLQLAEYGKHEEVAKLLREAMQQAGITPKAEGITTTDNKLTNNH